MKSNEKKNKLIHVDMNQLELGKGKAVKQCIKCPAARTLTSIHHLDGNVLSRCTSQ